MNSSLACRWQKEVRWGWGAGGKFWCSRIGSLVGRDLEAAAIIANHDDLVSITLGFFHRLTRYSKDLRVACDLCGILSWSFSGLALLGWTSTGKALTCKAWAEWLWVRSTYVMHWMILEVCGCMDTMILSCVYYHWANFSKLTTFNSNFTLHINADWGLSLFGIDNYNLVLEIYLGWQNLSVDWSI